MKYHNVYFQVKISGNCYKAERLGNGYIIQLIDKETLQPKDEKYGGYNDITIERNINDGYWIVVNPSEKIFGYKCPYDLFSGDVLKDTIYVKVPYKDRFYIPQGNATLAHAVAKEIVERWEPVYDNVKVGDYLIVTKIPEKPHWMNDGTTKHLGTVVKVDREKTQYAGGQMMYKVVSLLTNEEGGLPDGCYRKATEREVEDATVIKIAGFTSKIENGRVHFGCRNVSFETVKDLRHVAQEVSVSINGKVMTTELLDKLLRYIEINK